MKFDNLYEELFYKALRIRLVEEKIIELYPSDKIQSPVHLSIGQEAIAVGVCQNLFSKDLLYSSYRSHAYYLAKGADLKAMFAELYGKYTGCGKGKAGSMHLASKEHGLMGSSAIVASTISHAVGSALANKRLNKTMISVATFGDGATEEGSYHESLNFASVFQVPVLFVCENNGLAIHSKLKERQSYSIIDHAKSYNIKTEFIENGYDFEYINARLANAIEEMRTKKIPYFFEIKTYRYMEHVGIGDDHAVPYRSTKEYENWKANDPLIHNKKLIEKFSSLIKEEIQTAVEFAESSPYPSESELFSDVY